jgi:hypothetical protein
MVGFKSFITLYLLLILAACVPQTKQTECSTNEAFNATLRMCVPVMNGPSSFINISSVLPTSATSKFKTSSTVVNFSVTISNPYAQSFSVSWKRLSPSGTTYGISGTSSGSTFTTSIIPNQLFNASLANDVGLHVITATVVDSNNDVVDEHSFQFLLNNTPTPEIDSTTYNPPSYVVLSTPQALPPIGSALNFGFDTKNNGLIITGLGYRTDWFLYRGGILIDNNTSPSLFTNTGINDINSSSYSFDPSAIDGITIGSYVLIGKVTNTAGDPIDARQWSITVSHPTLPKVTSRNIYKTSTSPGFSTVSTAYHGVAYTDWISTEPLDKSFIPNGAYTAQGDYCVTIADAQGAYTGDNQGVRVDFYLDNATMVYSASTDDTNGTAEEKVCLSDGGPAGATSNVMFTNTTSTATQAHTIVAHVYDEATGQEYTTYDMAGNWAYPLTWNFSVKPANAAPTVAFTTQTLTGITCSSSSSTAKTCAVTQDSAFTVGVKVTDDFYSTITNQNKFSYTMVLMKNGTPYPGQSCTKTILNASSSNAVGSDAGGTVDEVGPDYICTFTVPSYDANGSINPGAFAWSVKIDVSDVGSPIAGSAAMASTTLNYNLNVTEANTAPVIVAQGTNSTTDSYLSLSSVLPLASNDIGALGTYALEGNTLNFNVKIQDSQRDDHIIRVYLCTDLTSSCATSALVATQTVNKTDNVLTQPTQLSYTLPENLLPITTPAGTNVDVYFKVQVEDIPDTVSALISNTSTSAPVHFNLNVRNTNPAPQFAQDNPLDVTDPIITFAGYPLSINAGTITDASLATTENTPHVQWYIDDNGGDDSYVAITGATSPILDWTPSNKITAGTTVNLAVCVDDGTVMNPQPSTASIGALIGSTNPVLGYGSNCFGSWDVEVKQHIVPTAYFNGTVNVGDEIAVWQDTTVTNKNVIYSAYNDANGMIYVEKTVFDSDGKIYNNTTSGFQTISFSAIDGTVADPTTIKDLSLAGTDEFLYIAYRAAPSSSPNSPRVRIRRIDKRSGATTGSKTDVATHPEPGKFGFMYSQSPPTFSTITPGSVTINSPAPGQPYVITFVSSLTAGDEVVVNGVTFTASSTAPTGGILCSGGSLGCSTTGNAQLLANAINSSSDRLLQGVTAVQSGSTVTLYGDINAGESADGNTTALLSSYIPGKQGKIMTYYDSVGGVWSWYLPFVDVSHASSNIRMLTASAGAGDYLRSTTITDNIVYNLTADPLNGIGPVNWFTNDLFGNEIIIASINTSSVAKLTTYPLGSAVATTKNTIFGGSPVKPASLKLAARVTNNAYNYVAGEVLISLSPLTYEWKFGRYDSSLLPSPVPSPAASPAPIPAEETFSNLSNNAATATVLANIADFTIEAMPNSSEARLIVSSNNGTTDYDVFAVRYRNDGKLSCDLCVPLTYGTQELSSTQKIATTKINTAMALGSTNGVPVSRDVFFTAFSLDSDADGIFEPQVGIINSTVEAMSTTTTEDDGSVGFRPAIFGPN